MSLNVVEFLRSLIDQDVVVKLKDGSNIVCKVREVSNDGSLLVSNIRVLKAKDRSLAQWGNREVVIRKDNIVAVLIP